MIDENLRKRIQEELVRAGISRYSLRKNEVRYLPQVIHKDEHIGAAINGRTDVGSVMLIATDRRVIYVDCKSFYTTVDELTYDVVSGLVYHVQGLFANVILHTRIGDYNLRFVNPKQAGRFTEFIEAKRVESPDGRTRSIEKNEDLLNLPFDATSIKLDKKQRSFLHTHNIGVLSTVDRTGNLHGAVMYYVPENDHVYLLTKSETAKARSILAHHQVALTVFEELTYETLQLSGYAEVVNDNEVRARIFNHILKIRNLLDQKTPPPVTKIQEGSYQVIKVSFTEAKYYKYKD